MADLVLTLTKVDVTFDDDCPDDITAWGRDHLEQAAYCVSYLEQGIVGHDRDDLTLMELVTILRDALEDDTAHRKAFCGWDTEQVEHAAAAMAFLRHGLTTGQSEELTLTRVSQFLCVGFDRPSAAATLLPARLPCSYK